MSDTTANGKTILHKGDGLQHVAATPDVCKTPSPAGPVPIPYPNTAKAADTSGGPTTVNCDGEMPMVKGSKYSQSMGDEAGTAGGVVSSCNRGEAEFMMYSFDVKFDGKNACRMGDPLFHNKKNIPG